VRKTLTGLVTVALALTLVGCGSGDSKTTGVYANKGATIGIAMPTKTSPRWINDGNSMAQQFKAMGYKVELKYGDSSPSKPNDIPFQVKQVQTMVNNGDKLLVIGAIDGSSMSKVLASAASKHIPVIAYDRLLTGTKNVNFQATFDNLRVGRMQAQLLLDRLHVSKGSGGHFNIELTAGSPTDANAHSFYNGSMAVLKPFLKTHQINVLSGETGFTQIATVNYDGAIAGSRIKSIVSTFYQTKPLDAVLSPYDGMSIGIIKALKSVGYGTGTKKLPLTSGQDAELPSIKSIIAGEQTFTIYKDTRELAKVAVQQGNALLTGDTAMVNDTTTFKNGVKTVPTYLLPPIEVDKTNYKTLLVDGGYYTAAQVS